MPAPNQDERRSNVHTGILEVKILLDNRGTLTIGNEYLSECFFVEDIFSTCLSGRISFLDHQGIYEYGPFTGNETLSIVYGRNKPREVIFHIISVEKIIPSTTTSSQVAPYIVIEIADTTYEWFTSYRYSRSYEKNQKHTDVVKHIIQNMVQWKGNLNIVPSTSEIKKDFCIPYWNPKQAIDYLLKRAYTNDYYGYLCYTNTEKTRSVNVKPLSYLLSSNNVTDQNNYKLEVDNNVEDAKELKNKVLEWWIEGLDHSKTRSIRNVKWMGYDINTKKVYESDYSYSNGIKSTPIMGKYSLFENVYDTGGILYSGVNKLSGCESVMNLTKFATNNFMKTYNLQQLVNIITVGNERRYAGHQILIDWKSINQESKTKNRMYNGAYLVKSITHDFISDNSPFGYVQRMVLIKNGYQEPSTSVLKKSNNINLVGGRTSAEFDGV